MGEDIYNIFLFSDDKYIKEIGVTIHNIEGSDNEKTNFLLNKVYVDYFNSKIFPVPKNYQDSKDCISHDKFFAMERIGQSINFFEEIFKKINASRTPLYVVTHVNNGKIKIDWTGNHDGFSISGSGGNKDQGIGVRVDYLDKYFENGTLDISSLINNEHYEAIRLLFNNKFYVASLKLMLSFIDMISYIEYGDIKENNFIKWLDNYSQIQNLGISSTELWELRNSLLHMSNFDSYKVKQGKVHRLCFFVAPKESRDSFIFEGSKYFNYRDLISDISKSLGKWLETYLKVPSKLAVFVMRYDNTASDSRYSSFTG